MTRTAMGLGAAIVLLAGACLASPARAADPADGSDGQEQVEQGVNALMGAMGSGLKHLWGGHKNADAVPTAQAAPAPPAVAKPASLVTPAPPETPEEAEGLGSAFKAVAGSVLGGEIEAHDYEAPLTQDDRICTQEVDPFRISDNLEDVAETATRTKLTNLLTKLVVKEKKSDPEKTLAVARAAARRLNWMPMALEVRYGASLHARRAEADPKLLPRPGKGAVKRAYAKADALLARVLSHVEGENPYHFQLFLEDHTELNAAAAPGGYLYMTTGALDSDHAELILAHEVAHVLKRHETRELQARLIDLVHTHAELKALLKERDTKPAQLAVRVASLVGDFIRLSRQQELQADACSVRIVASASDTDRDLDGLVDAYVASLKGDATSAQAWYHVSSHPDYPDRAERMKEVADALKAAPEAAQATASAPAAEDPPAE